MSGRPFESVQIGQSTNTRFFSSVTPILGILCIPAIIFLIDEPERGKAEKEQGAEEGETERNSSFWQDIAYLARNKTYVLATLGYTATVFVTGTLTW